MDLAVRCFSLPTIREGFAVRPDQEMKVRRHQDTSHKLESQVAAQPIQRLDKLASKPRRVEQPSPAISGSNEL
jgi:hypothetical protein